MIWRSLFLFLALALLAMPRIAVAADDLRVVRVLEGKAEVSIPAEFALMTDDMKLRRYPSGNPPKEVYSNEDGTVNVAMKTSTGARGTIDQILAGTAKTIEQVREVTWHDKGKREINGREFGYLEFTSKPFETEIYNYLFFTLRDGDLLLFTVNSTAEKLPAWKDKIAAIVGSTRITTTP